MRISCDRLRVLLPFLPPGPWQRRTLTSRLRMHRAQPRAPRCQGQSRPRGCLVVCVTREHGPPCCEVVRWVGRPARVPRLPRRSAMCRDLVVMEPHPIRAPEVLSLQIRGHEGISMALSSTHLLAKCGGSACPREPGQRGCSSAPAVLRRALDVASRERRRAACGTDGRGAGLRVQRVSRSRSARRRDAVFQGGPSLPRASPATVCRQDCTLGPQAVWGAGGCAASSQEAKKYKVIADEPEGFGG